MSLYIPAEQNVSTAWLATLRAVSDNGGTAVNVVTTVTDPLAEETPSIRAAIDAILIDGHRGKTRIQPVDTVAATIFPRDLYADPETAYSPDQDSGTRARVDQAAADLYDAYQDMLPLLCTDPANARGTYFSRMITWPGKTGQGINQLQDRIVNLRRALHQQNVNDIVIGGEAEFDVEPVRGLQILAPTDRRPRGFPCLVHLDLTLHAGRLSMAAVYRHQMLVTKAYGNLLGLAGLLGFLAQQTGSAPGELMVTATLADAEYNTFRKATVCELLASASAQSSPR